MVIVIATSDEELDDVRARLGDLSVSSMQVVAAAETRRLVLAVVDDETEGARVAAALRAAGTMAVIRPDAGPRLGAWMEHTRPITLGPRLSVCFAWCEHDRTALPGLIELGLGGFGNGAHVSTRLLIEQMLERIRGGERVLDVGCGSGVLGLCALELGAAQVVAVDIKPAAVEAARRNSALNHRADRFHATCASLAEIDGPFDIVLANIGRAASVELAPQLVRLVAPGGWLALSGISPTQCSQMAGFLAPLVELDQRTSGEWSALVMGQPSTGSGAT